MSATYNTRVMGKLTDLANILSVNNYRNEAAAVRSIIGKISNWKEGKEWNPDNALSLPDADHVLEELVVKFKMSIIEAKRKEMLAKRQTSTETSTAPTENMEAESAKNLNALETAIKSLEKLF